MLEEVLAPESVRPIQRREFERMVAVGFFEDERVELIRGTLVTMSPQGAFHADVTRQLTELLVVALAGRAQVRAHSPLAVSDDSEPEPDVAVVPPGNYSSEHPARAYLVVEVAESSLRKDREIKAGLYARAGVPEYWLVNLIDRVVEVHTSPAEERYTSVVRRGAAETLRMVSFADVTISVARLFPAA